MKQKKTEKRKFKPVAAALRAVDMPEETDSGIIKLTVLGYRRALVENHRGISAYTDGEILFEAPAGRVCIEGEQLEIRELNKEKALVEGSIRGIYHED